MRPANVSVHKTTLVTTVLNCPSGYSCVLFKNKASGCPAAVSMPWSTLMRELSWSIPCSRCLSCLIPHFTMSRSALVLKLAGVLSLWVLWVLKFFPRVLSKIASLNSFDDAIFHASRIARLPRVDWSRLCRIQHGWLPGRFGSCLSKPMSCA